MLKTLPTVAEEIAIKAHEGQKYGKKPYTAHLEDVVGVLLRFGVFTESIVAAGWLHDVIEDTDMTLGTLRAKLSAFDPAEVAFVLAAVDAVTDGEGANRKERKERPYKLLPKNPNALLVKLADRIANVEAAKDEGKDGLLGMYGKEHAVFSARLHEAIHASDVAKDMWWYLDEILKPYRRPTA